MLNINATKTKIVKVHEKTGYLITINNGAVEDVSEFVYLGSKITNDGNSEKDVSSRVSKAKGTFVALKNIWKSSQLKTSTKLRIFKTNVLAVLLYGTELRKVTQSISDKLDIF